MVDSARSILRYAVYMCTNYRFYFFKDIAIEHISCAFFIFSHNFLHLEHQLFYVMKPSLERQNLTFAAGVPRWTPKQTGGGTEPFLVRFGQLCGVALCAKLKWKRWFQICFSSVHPYVGKMNPILLIFSKGGWNHRVVNSSWESFWGYPNAPTPCLLQGRPYFLGREA